MVTIYQRTSNGGIRVFPYTSTGQFKSHAAAHRYLENRRHNGSCTFVTQCDYVKALRLYGNS